MHSRNGKNQKLKEILIDIDDLPFITIETDVSLFPQLISAKLVAFLLKADRFHRHMMAICENCGNRDRGD